MNVIRGLENWKPVRNPVVTVGSFDGVHLAHRAIVDLLNREAELLGGESVLLTFSPHPRLVLASSDAYGDRFRLLSSEDEKIDLLSRVGLGNLLIVPFDEAFSRIPYDTFIEKILVGTVRVRKVVVGYNHNFGHGRAGHYEQMQEYGRRYGFEVDRFPEQMVEQEHVSSTRIRNLLLEGDVSKANELLGYGYGVQGSFRSGGFIASDPYKLLPGSGAYLVKIKNRNAYNYTVCRIGTSITFPDLGTVGEGDSFKVHFIKKVLLPE